MRFQARHWIFALQLAAACMITWWVSNGLFYGLVTTKTDMLGSMWAVVSTIFVLRETHTNSLSAGLVRIVATVTSVVICSIYFLFFSFNPFAMVVLIVIGYLVCNAIGRPDDAATTGITITVVMVVGGLESESAKIEPLLRLADTLIGSAIAIATAWFAKRLWKKQAEEAVAG
ncbi:MAG: FUSC family protein [Candidatus Binatia bacterium]|jgi:uncharacterized membrane protein YccC